MNSSFEQGEIVTFSARRVEIQQGLLEIGDTVETH